MERKTKFIAVIVILCAALIIIPRLKILFEGDEGRIERIVYSAKNATEREDLLKCISLVSFDYSDKYGNDRSSLLMAAKQVFLDYDNIIIGISKLEVELDDGSAKAQVEATGIARNVSREETNIFEKDTVKFLIFFKKEEAGWKVIELEFLEPRDVLPPGII